MTHADPDRSEPGPDATVDDIQADIEATRHELGQTVEALTAKLDVKAQAKQKAADTKELIAEKAETVRARGTEVGARIVDVSTDHEGSVRPQVYAAAIAGIALVVGVVIWRRRR